MIEAKFPTSETVESLAASASICLDHCPKASCWKMRTLYQEAETPCSIPSGNYSPWGKTVRGMVVPVGLPHRRAQTCTPTGAARIAQLTFTAAYCHSQESSVTVSTYPCIAPRRKTGLGPNKLLLKIVSSASRHIQQPVCVHSGEWSQHSQATAF